MEKQKTKLGARILSASELNAILPNAESIYDQIEMFRTSIPDENDDQQEMEQKTNNIGIMGCRGAGKTSILRTFYDNLKKKDLEKKDNEKNTKSRSGDIILPIIIPENMSSGTTLMDVVLGMLKPVVEARKKERDNTWAKDCIYSGRDSLEKEYNELVKQYCYIKKDYRDILIQQFTTEQNYVDKTKEVFNSDSEFIRLFNQFVKSLLRSEDQQTNNSMIFLFIDDIDLSAHRCMDVVKTLLSYLSNPRIVTFISGDMETFEEALTLEFLRQEKALNADLIDKTYYSTSEQINDSDLLSRKKILAYDYLKKIIPPAYRRSIKYWSLEERGSYQIIEKDNQEPKTLAELLVDISKEKLGDSYFVYKENNEQKYMSLAFHMFDKTSRGLNNVYNILQELYHIKMQKESSAEFQREDLKMFSLWRLIDAIIDSKRLYTKYKEQLLYKIIVLEQTQVKIDFENAYQLLYEKFKENLTPEKRFAMFFLIDFSAKLFSKEQQYNNYYIHLKNKIILEYLSDDSIDGKIASSRPIINWENNQKVKSSTNSAVKLILINFLKQCDFIFVLHLIRYLGKAEIYNILEDSKNNQHLEKEHAYKVAFAFAKAIQAIKNTTESRQDYIAHLHMQMQDTILSLLNMISLNPYVIYGNQLTDGITITVSYKHFMKTANNLANKSYENIENYLCEVSSYDTLSKRKEYFLWAEYENRNSLYWLYYEQKLREKNNMEFNIYDMSQDSISSGITKTIMNQMQEIIEKYRVKKLQEVNYNNLSDDIEKKVILQIDKNALWNTQYVKEKVVTYLETKRRNYVSTLSHGRNIFNATEIISGAYSELKNCYKGSSGTALVYRLLDNITNIMFLLENEKLKFSDGKYYLRLEQLLIIQCLLKEFLSRHARVKYGKKETRQLLMEIKELPLVFHTAEWDNIHKELEEREKVFFHKIEKSISMGPETEKIRSTEEFKTILETIYEEYYNAYVGETKPLCLYITNHFHNITEEGIIYVQYLIQQKHIQKKLNELLRETNGHLLEWSDIEKTIPREDYLFIFHGYLRYLQANNSEFEKAGIKAEAIATLAQDILASEVIADDKIQNEVFEIISKEIDITEEEFEKLF